MIPETPDHCATLGIKRGASNEELHAAYRRLALIHHPDKNKGNEEVATAKFQEVQRAFEALRDTEEDVTQSTPGGAQWEDTRTATPTSNHGEGDSFAWFDANWGPNFSRRWNEDELRSASGRDRDADWFDERGWRSRGSAFTSQHPGFGVFGRLFTHLPPLPPLEIRVERNRRNNNWRETTRSFRLFS
ncbi:DnaJ domain-containing protein [Xylaria cf. heliscus]|nr:DnaJ domain-containing protein [Xylaria cf. heliscus]